VVGPLVLHSLRTYPTTPLLVTSKPPLPSQEGLRPSRQGPKGFSGEFQDLRTRPLDKTTPQLAGEHTLESGGTIIMACLSQGWSRNSSLGRVWIVLDRYARIYPLITPTSRQAPLVHRKFPLQNFQEKKNRRSRERLLSIFEILYCSKKLLSFGCG
jgi:hypothetical protein